MTMDAQIGSVVSGSHHLLRLLCRLPPFIPKEDIAVVVGTIINSRLDYANALYLGLPKYQITRLQVVQNTAARLVTGKKTMGINLTFTEIPSLVASKRQNHFQGTLPNT